MDINFIYNIDAISLLKELKKTNIKVDLLLTDPPYNISRENNFKTLGRAGIDFGSWDKDFNQIEWLKHIFSVLKDGASVIIFNDWKNMGNISQVLEKHGFIIKDLIRWIKPNPQPRNIKRRYVTDYEFAIWAVKPGLKWTFNKEEEKKYLKPEYIATPPMGKNRIHPTQKSGKLIEEIIKVHSNEGDIILDPFSGSAEISYQANRLNRFYIGSEINKKYCDKANKRIISSYIKPIFNHLGNKHRMLHELKRNMPKKEIEFLVDVFAGSGVVSANSKVSKIFLNEGDKRLSQILEYLLNTKTEIILENIEKAIQKYNLPKNEFKPYKEGYNKLKQKYNKTKEVHLLFVLVLFGFNQQIRFNSKDQFNIPTGKFTWNEYHKQKIIDFKKSLIDKNISIRNLDFKKFFPGIFEDIKMKNTLFYFDPPYLLSNATYNSNWTDEDEKELLKILKTIDARNGKFLLSNVLVSKGKRNVLLEKFVSSNPKFKLTDVPINYSNSNYQRKFRNEKDVEVLVKNYEVN